MELHEHKYTWYKFGCKDASYLKVKSSYTSLNWSEKLLYNFHLLICKYCRKFVEQIEIMDKWIKSKGNKASISMSDSKKTAINQQINDFLTNNNS